MPRMQSQTRFLTSSHQRRRLALWAAAMLLWIGALLFAAPPVSARQFAQRHRRLSLDYLTRLVINLMLVRAGELAQGRLPRRFRFHARGRDLKRRHYMRSLVGSRLRRVLKPKNIAARIANLIAVLRDLDLYARQLGQRRPTRLWPIALTPDNLVLALAPPASSPARTAVLARAAFCDSS
jgi:hypothetical protein